MSKLSTTFIVPVHYSSVQSIFSAAINHWVENYQSKTSSIAKAFIIGTAVDQFRHGSSFVGALALTATKGQGTQHPTITTSKVLIPASVSTFGGEMIVTAKPSTDGRTEIEINGHTQGVLSGALKENVNELKDYLTQFLPDLEQQHRQSNAENSLPQRASVGIAEEIEHLSNLHKAGAISEDEYAQAKRQILGLSPDNTRLVKDQGTATLAITNEFTVQQTQSHEASKQSAYDDEHAISLSPADVSSTAPEDSSNVENKSRIKLWLIGGIAIIALAIGLIVFATATVKSEPKCENITQLRLAAFFGNPDAQYQLGIRYETGDGVEKDITKFIENINKAAEQGNSKAQFELGLIYFKGEVASKDMTKAIYWMSKAAEQGNANMGVFLGGLYFNGDGVPMDIAKAIDYWSKAAALNEPQAQSILGILYYYGNNVTQDTVRGLDLLNKAAAQSNDDAIHALKEIALSTSDENQRPLDVISFLDRREGCDHFRGEEPYDEERRKFLLEKMHELCDGTDNQLDQLKRKYSTLPNVMTKLNSYELRIESSQERTAGNQIGSKGVLEETGTLPSTEDITMYKFPGFPTRGKCDAFRGDKGWRELHGIPNGVVTFEDAKQWAKKHTVPGLSELLSVSESPTHISFNFDELLPELKSVTTYYKDMATCKFERHEVK